MGGGKRSLRFLIFSHPDGLGRLLLIQPVFHAQLRNLPEVTEVGGKDKGLVSQRDRCDLEVHRPDAHAVAAKVLEAVGCLVTKR